MLPDPSHLNPWHWLCYPPDTTVPLVQQWFMYRLVDHCSIQVDPMFSLAYNATLRRVDLLEVRRFRRSFSNLVFLWLSLPPAL